MTHLLNGSETPNPKYNRPYYGLTWHDMAPHDLFNPHNLNVFEYVIYATHDWHS